MKLTQIINKLKMNLDKRGLVEIRRTNLALNLLTYLKNHETGIEFEVVDKYILVNLSMHNIKTIRGYSPFLKYNVRELSALIKGTISKGSGNLVFSAAISPHILNHQQMVELGVGGNLICYYSRIQSGL